jgi:hypothetical protein
MTTFNLRSNDNLPDLQAGIDAFAEPGVDPAFDADMEELERQFAEIRLTFDHN